MGGTIVLGERRLDRLPVRPGVGGFGPVGTDGDLRRWLAGAGVADAHIDRRGVFAFFTARKPER